MSDQRHIRVLVTGPDVRQDLGAGIQQHVRYVMRMFEGAETVTVEPFAITSVVRDEPWALKAVRLLWVYARLLVTAPRFDVVHVNSTIDNRSIVRDAGATAIARLLGRPVVYQFHGGSIERLSMVRRGALSKLCGRALRSARTVLFLSEQQQGPVDELYHLTRSRRIANFVPVEASVPTRTPHDGLHVLFLGRLHPDKGVAETIAGFRSARRDGWELRVAGSGPAESEVREALATTAGARFEGFVEGDAKLALLEWADVFVLPTAHAEGMPYGALEAMASGCALVASANAGLGDLVREGVTGIVVPPLDAPAVAAALGRLADDPELLARAQAAARRIAVAEYSLGRGAEEFESLYRAALA